jgi:hypothetical protein
MQEASAYSYEQRRARALNPCFSEQSGMRPAELALQALCCVACDVGLAHTSMESFRCRFLVNRFLSESVSLLLLPGGERGFGEKGVIHHPD